MYYRVNQKFIIDNGRPRIHWYDLELEAVIQWSHSYILNSYRANRASDGDNEHDI